MKLAHSMVRARDEAASLKFYDSVFGLKIVDRLDFEAFTLIYLAAEPGGFELELTINKGRDAPYDLGDGYGHLALIVDDLEAQHDKAKAAGYAPRDIVDFKPGGERVARFFFIADPDGYQVEVIERGGSFV